MKKLNEGLISNLLTKILIFMVSGKSIKTIENRYKEDPELTKRLKSTRKEITELRKAIEQAEARQAKYTNI